MHMDVFSLESQCNRQADRERRLGSLNKPDSASLLGQTWDEPRSNPVHVPDYG